MKTVEVVAGIILNDSDRIYCVQRGESSKPYISKKWEFPGGKLEEGETREEALIRELKEELKIDVNPFEFVITIDHTYPDFRIIMHVFKCNILNDNEPVLTEHLQSKWLTVSELDNLDWAAADIPIVKSLK
ncbi:8-oxo-dGTP diphosphatase MutT [Schleiferiaceae bacterium]|nr:8-oxo-dGTP diphosphatase MutT [Schleiferiaceae bacterium]